MKLKRHKGPILVGLAVTLALVVALVLGISITSASPALQPITPKLISGNLGSNYIQIDDLDNNPNTTPNANMITVGTTDLTCQTTIIAGEVNSNCPYSAGQTYIDWNTLASPPPGANKYVILDGSGSDDDSFGGTPSKSCLQPAHAAPQKEDVLRIYLANNSEYFYFGEIDKVPQGNSRHVFLLHKNPVMYDPAVFCAGDGHDLWVDLSWGDKLIKVVFQPSAGEPAAQLYDLARNPDMMLLDAAADFSDGSLWTSISGVANFAVNTSDVPTDALGAGQLNSAPVKAWTFGEGAISLEDLGISPCGGIYNISVITRSSGSGGGESKDFIGGAYNFGQVEATATLTATCDLAIDKLGNATDASGNAITEDSAFDWTFYKCDTPATCDTVNENGTLTTVGAADIPDGTEPNDRVGTYNVTNGAGKYYAVLKVTDTPSECFDYAASNAVTLYTPIDINPVMAGSCNADGTWTFDAQPNTPATCSWTFTDTNTSRNHSPTNSSNVSGSGTTTRGNAAPDTINGSVTCTQTRTDTLICQDSGNASATVYAPIIANADLTGSCSLTFDYASNATGGSGSYNIAWVFTDGDGRGVTPPTSTTASGSGSIPRGDASADDVTGNVTYSDPNAAGSECTPGSDEDTATVYAPILVNIAPNSTSLTCNIPGSPGSDNGNIGPGVTYTATASGGAGPLTYDWTVTGPNTVTCTGGVGHTTCVIDIPDDKFCALTQVYVTVDDGNSCAPATSETETVTKITQVNATNN